MRDRTAYFQAYHAEHREERNAVRREQYVPTGRPSGRPRRESHTSYRARRSAELSGAPSQAEIQQLLHIANEPELLALFEAQRSDARTYRIEHPGWAGATERDHLFYGITSVVAA